MQYTEEQVQLAHFANAMQADMRAQGAGGLQDLGIFAAKELPQREADFAAGLKILGGARLVSSRRWALGTGHTAHIEGEVDSPLVGVPAGYLATQEMRRWVALRHK
jgi:hypothetical protein